MADSRLNKLAEQLAAADLTTSSSNTDATYRIKEQPLGSTRHLRIIGIGAGMSGINMIRTLRLHLTDYEHVIYEKNPSIGGTWFENRYPGCKCDVPSHNYQFSWRPNPRWSSFFPSAPEIEEYLCQVCKEEDMYPLIKTEHEVVKAQWEEDEGMWFLEIRNLQDGTVLKDKCHILLDGSGILK